MSQPSSPADGLPTLGTVPLGPDEPELFADAMERIIRHLGSQPTGRRATSLPGRQGSQTT
jgi:hypothetical protein